MSVQVLNAVVLPGWMEQEEAVAFLRRSCVGDPAISEEAATDLWRKYRRRVEALPERTVARPPLLPIPDSAQPLIDEFLKLNPAVPRTSIVRIDPMGLLAYQPYVVTDVAEETYGSAVGETERFRRCLFGSGNNKLKIRLEADGFHIDLPHCEFQLRLIESNGTFRVLQGGRGIAVSPLGSRLVLSAGYHRCFAWCRRNRDSPANRTVLAGLQKDVPPLIGPDAANPALRNWLSGPRPPMMADFLDERLALPVRLPRKRYELHVRGDLRAIDVEEAQ